MSIASDSVYRQRTHGDWPTEEHYAEELVLLYVCAFAIEELRRAERARERGEMIPIAVDHFVTSIAAAR